MSRLHEIIRRNASRRRAGMEVALRLRRPVTLDARLTVRGFTALLGASGAGKSSLLRALAGLLPSEGTPYAGLPAAHRPVGYLPQGGLLFPHLSVWRNVAYALDGPRRERREAALRWLAAVGIADLADRDARRISGGEQQRVALARALARRPDLLLLDEPTAALDAPTREALMAELIGRLHGLGVPALAATHDPVLAAMADWLAVLHGGRIVQEGKPDAVFAAPAGPEAAALLGWRNVFAGVVEAAESGTGGVRLRWDEAGAIVAAAGGGDPGSRLRWGVPESAVVIGDVTAHAGPVNRLVVRLESLYRLAGQCICLFRCGAALLWAAVPERDARTPGLTPGANVAIAFPPAGVRFWPDAG